MTVLQEMRQLLVQHLERRSEPRTFGERQVIITMSDVARSLGSATALDWSTRGLRIRHTLPLHKEDVVGVLTPEWEAEARVVWLLENDQSREAGLVFLGPPRFDNA